MECRGGALLAARFVVQRHGVKLQPVIDQVEAELQKHPAAFPQIVLTSSDKGQGITTLRAIIAGLD